VTITPPGRRLHGAEYLALTSAGPGQATAAGATLGGAGITGGTAWNGSWNALPAGPRAGISLAVPATTAVIVKIYSGN
jgi:hypothetical protein